MKRREFLCTLAAIGALPVAGAALAAGERMVVYKDPHCGCCHVWADAMKNAGFSVQAENVDDLDAVKDRFAVPTNMRGCHTAVVAGYYLEGHVPLDAVMRLLSEKPEIAGLAVPGMPAGSLGMGDDPRASYDVLAVGKDGANKLYQAVRPKA
ncbi:DUF411 domain-containing protein [Agrobacterium vitis]|uniref:DUF411 domain-containing protein n=1 Tax=Agrobacterium vitis TaxID=373 RepID=A0AAE5AYI2_AGRVI|nr:MULTISPECIES: DUF411 domain-containing protein [Rhizobium/Agrobacterium group]MCF1464083.1 DUF411 domain-containing protein [Allorhizobium ampelinum]MCF1479665.1 DUF411 domain-containing protein [Agrobacterium vitis]MCM2476250.1 DUF411 domain-containing protein [Rhizobium sp. CG5]MUO72011.1 DUF411 domain-containing protein [Agrobacterium vitis]MUZ60606.1 DUF411 domain-containing protein [Agrobacterium vitis]